MLKRFLRCSFLPDDRPAVGGPAASRADQGGPGKRAGRDPERDRRCQAVPDETHRNKRETLGQLALLQRRLRLRESAIRNINAQIDVIQGDMNESWREILKLRKNWTPSRIQYAQSIVFAYKNRSSYDFLNFIFSATPLMTPCGGSNT